MGTKRKRKTEGRHAALNMAEQGLLSLRQRAALVLRLSVPGILAQVSEIAMEYIDAAMVGSLGADCTAAIGLTASTTWLIGGILLGAAAGINVQIAQEVGAGRNERARRVLHTGCLSCLILSLVLALICLVLTKRLPYLLGGSGEVARLSSVYFGILAAGLPIQMAFYFHNGALQSAGSMAQAGALSALACVLDIVFNALLIFPTREVFSMRVPGAGLGLAGAALGTVLSQLVSAVLAILAVHAGSPVLSVHRGERGFFDAGILKRQVQIGGPVALEQVILCGAQVVTTRLASPLGTVPLAANSLAVTAEAVCYMPGYGIASAATTLVGQAFGAGRRDLVRSFSWMTVFLGMALMTLTGGAMYVLCPYVFSFLTPDPAVQSLGARVLRIELLAEPLFAASIVAAGALRGVGDTLVPAVMTFVSMWGVRISLSLILTPRLGLWGIWIAMCLELMFRGTIFLIRLHRSLRKMA